MKTYKNEDFIINAGVLMEYKGEGGDVIIPDSVVCIGYRAFYNCTSLTNITIPDSVTSIGYKAFYNCDSLTSIIIPDRVTSIGYSAFYGCSKLQLKQGNYKAFDLSLDGELSCRQMPFKIGEIAKVEGRLVLCDNGLHYCTNMFDIFNYYHGELNKDITICEIDVLGDVCDVDTRGNKSENSKRCTNKLRVVRQLSNQEIIDIMNNKQPNKGVKNDILRRTS